MTHFVSTVIVSKDIFEKGEEETKDFIGELMEPYSENYELEPYIDKTKEELKEEFDKWKNELQEKLDKKEEIDSYNKKYIEDGKIKANIKEWAESWYGLKLDKYGNLLSTWNKKSFWDWYVVGGRWDGVIRGNISGTREDESVMNNSIPVRALLQKMKKREEKNIRKREHLKEVIEAMKNPFGDFGFADIFREFFKHEKTGSLTTEESEFYEKITKRFGEFLEKFEFYNPYIIYKVLDKEGKLYEGKSFGWFGMSSDTETPEQWIKTYTKILEDNQEDYIVTLDCHV